MNLIFDATLSPRLARVLKTLLEPEHSATHIRDALGHDATDQRIGAFIQSTGDAMMVTVDLDISDNPHRIAALREWNCPVVLISSAWLELKPWDQAWMFLRLVPALLNKCQALPGAPVYLVAPGMKGRIRKIA